MGTLPRTLEDFGSRNDSKKIVANIPSNIAMLISKQKDITPSHSGFFQQREPVTTNYMWMNKVIILSSQPMAGVSSEVERMQAVIH